MFLKEILWFKAVYLIKFLFNSETQSAILSLLGTPNFRGASRHERRIFGEKSIGEIKKNIFILNSDVKFSEKFLNKKLLTF